MGIEAFGYLVVFGSVLFLSYVTTKFIGNKAGKALNGKLIKIVETVNLGFDKQIHIVKVENEFFLISSAGKSIGFLTQVKVTEDMITSTLNQSEKFNFNNILSKYLVNSKNSEDASDNTFNVIKDSIKQSAVFSKNLNVLKNITRKIKNNSEDEANK